MRGQGFFRVGKKYSRRRHINTQNTVLDVVSCFAACSHIKISPHSLPLLCCLPLPSVPLTCVTSPPPLLLSVAVPLNLSHPLYITRLRQSKSRGSLGDLCCHTSTYFPPNGVFCPSFYPLIKLNQFFLSL